MPVALAADRRQDRGALRGPQGQKVTHLRAAQAPLLPVAHAHAPAQPLIELWDRTVVLRDAEVAHPAAHILGKLYEPIGHRDAPAAPGQFPHAVLEVFEGRRRPAKLALTEGESEEHAFVDRRHTALVLVDRQLELPGKIRSDTRLHALACPGAS